MRVSYVKEPHDLFAVRAFELRGIISGAVEHR